jgi:hypothetical protein
METRKEMRARIAEERVGLKPLRNDAPMHHAHTKRLPEPPVQVKFKRT